MPLWEKEWKGNHLKPYEKFLKHGAASLTDAELLAIIIRTGTKNASALSIAQKLLDRFEQNRQLNSLHHITIQELMEMEGIGEVKAVKIKCIAELSARMAKQHAAQTLDFKTPSSIADYYMEQMRHEEVEKVLLLLLDTKLHLMEEYLLSKGTVMLRCYLQERCSGMHSGQEPVRLCCCIITRVEAAIPSKGGSFGYKEESWKPEI